MTEITQDNLKRAKWKRFSWNNETIIEWWKPIQKLGSVDETHVGVKFGETRYLPYAVWLQVGHALMRCPNVRSIEDLETLYNLLKRDE